MSHKSEFGRGYATCLLMFAFHEPRIDEYVDLNATMRAADGVADGVGGRAGWFSEDDACESWANGASDHLYDLVKPKRGVTAAEWRRAKTLADRALDVGHGFRPRADATPTEMHELCSEARALIAAAAIRLNTPAPLTFDGAWRLDLAAGLRSVRGDAATCEKPLTLRRRSPR